MADLAEGARPIPNFLLEVILDISDLTYGLTRLRPAGGRPYLIASRIPPGLVSEALGLRLEAPGLKARGYRAVRHEGDSVLEEGEEEEGDEGTRPGELPGGGAHSLSACVSHTPPHTACHWRGPGGGRAALGRPGRLEAARAAAASHMLAMFHFQASRSRILLDFLDYL